MDVTKDRRGSTSPELPEDTQQETLPLYQEFQLQDPNAGADTVPSSTATPDEVRDYLASLLRKRHELPEDQVRRVVSHWTIGTGRELRIYTAQMYLNIFGSEYGWTLYRDVGLELYRTVPKNWLQDGRVYRYTAVVWVFACLAIVLLVLFHHMDSKVLFMLTVFFSVPIFLLTFVGTVWCVGEYFKTDTDPRVWIEQELQRCTRNDTASRTL